MTRELIDSELDTVAGGLFDAGFVLQSIDARRVCWRVGASRFAAALIRGSPAGAQPVASG